mgnify:FL=1
MKRTFGVGYSKFTFSTFILNLSHKHLLSTRCALDIYTEVWRKVLVPALAELSLKADTCKTHFYFRAGSVRRLRENRGYLLYV